MPNIHQQLIIEAPVEKVYQALTTQDGLIAWWTPGVTAKTEVNSIARFPFGKGYHKEMKIVDLKPNELVKWHCLQGDPEWIGTTLSFQMEAGDSQELLRVHPEMQGQVEQMSKKDKATLLSFHHDDWKAYTPMFAECSYTWGRFLRGLKLFCETGKGLPWPGQHSVK